MAAKCFSVVRGKVVRVTKVDSCGVVTVPVPAGDSIVSDGFVSVALSAELESGDEFITKNANGALCINERSPDNLKRLNVTIDWCKVNPDIFELITGYPAEVSDEGTTPSTDTVGFRVQEGLADEFFALEVWTGLAGSGACSPEGAQYGYILLPVVTGAVIGDLTIENGAATFQTTGYTQGNSQWGQGPYDVLLDTPALPGPPVVPATGKPLEEPIGPTDHALIRIVGFPPPVADPC